MNKNDLDCIAHQPFSRREEQPPNTGSKRQDKPEPEQSRGKWPCDTQKTGWVGETVHI
jgi:hypothetical protein